MCYFMSHYTLLKVTLAYLICRNGSLGDYNGSSLASIKDPLMAPLFSECAFQFYLKHLVRYSIFDFAALIYLWFVRDCQCTKSVL